MLTCNCWYHYCI